MNIIFLSQYYWPEERTAPKNLSALAEDFQSKGHEVTVITGFPNHPFGEIYDGYNMRPWSWEEKGGVKILRLPLYPDHSVSLVPRVFNYGSFAASASTIGLLQSLLAGADVIFAYLPPLTTAIPAALMKFAARAPIVYWITDIWPEVLAASGEVDFNPRTYNWIEKFGNWAYGRAKKICVNSPGFQENLIDKGVSSGKLETLVDWADEDLFFPVEPEDELAKRFGLDDHFNVVYGGNLGVVQGLDTVIEAARRLKDKEEIQFVFIGDGNDEERLKSLVDDYGLKNVLFIDRQPMDEIRRFFALADVLLVHLNKKPLFEMQIPSKIMAYLACGRPILGGVEGSAEKIILDANAGLTCPSENPEAMAEKVLDFYKMSDENREKYGARGRKSYLENYTREVQVERVNNILMEAAEI